MYAALFECRDYVARRGSGGLLLAGECEVDVVFGHKTFVYELFGGLHNGAERDFSVQRAAAPDDTFPQHALEGGLVPALAVGGHHVVVSHEDGGPVAGLAAPGVEHAAAAYALRRALLSQSGIALLEVGAELVKFGSVLIGRVGTRDGLAAYHLTQALDDVVVVYAHFVAVCPQFRARPVQRSPGEDHSRTGGKRSACGAQQELGGFLHQTSPFL